jgi:hypothetical protein
MTDAPRTPTPIDAIAEAWVDTSPSFPHRPPTSAASSTTDASTTSPGGQARRRRAATLAALEAAEPVDDVDVVTKADLAATFALARAPRGRRTCATST